MRSVFPGEHNSDDWFSPVPRATNCPQGRRLALSDQGSSHGFIARKEPAPKRHGRPVPAAIRLGSVRKSPEEVPGPAGHTLPLHLVQVPGIDEVPDFGGYRNRDDHPGFPAEIGRELNEDPIPEGFLPGISVDYLAKQGEEGISLCHRDRPLTEITRISSGSRAVHARSQSSLSVHCRTGGGSLRKSWSRSTPIFQRATSYPQFGQWMYSHIFPESVHQPEICGYPRTSSPLRFCPHLQRAWS